MSEQIPDCDKEIFEKGKTILTLDAKSGDAEAWVKSIAEKSKARLDWHYSGGIANVLHLGDDESKTRVTQAIEELKKNLNGTILGDSELYRTSVHDLPEGTIAVSST